MSRTSFCVFLAAFVMMLSGCTTEHTQSPGPEIEFVEYEQQEYPMLIAQHNEDIIAIINSEIESQFQRLYSSRHDGVIQTNTSTTDTMISILLKAEYDPSYGTDGEIWGICYDYVRGSIITCGAYLSSLGYSFADIYDNVSALLNDQGEYEYIDIPFFFFDQNSAPVLVVIAVEHPAGADAWKRICYYSPISSTFVDSPWEANNS